MQSNLETIRKCAQALLDASLDISRWDDLPPLVGTMAMMILEEVKATGEPTSSNNTSQLEEK